jgi:Protein of unknown function (DUF2726)
MDLSPVLSSFALPATVLVLVLLWLAMRLRQRLGRRGTPRDSTDTLAGWPPEVARVLTMDERQAFDLLRRAMPSHLVLAQVPLARFIRVPLRRSYSEWLQRVGALSADLLLCDAGSRVIAVVDVRAAVESERSRRRHERMARVLRQAGVHVITWREGELPSTQEVRTMFAPVLQPDGATPKALGSRPMPLIPVAEMEEILAEGDQRAQDDRVQEPVPSGYFDDFAVTPAQR